MSKKLLRIKEFCLATFKTTHGALKGEQVLENNALEILIIPTPREITASCGLSIKFDQDNLKVVQDLLINSALDFQLYFVKKGEKNLEFVNLSNK